jgi:adenylate cyclase
MDLSKRMAGLSLKSQGLHYRLSISFAFFFFVPLLGLLYFGLKYEWLEDRLLPWFILALLGSSLAGYVLIRKTFDKIRGASLLFSETLSTDLAGFKRLESVDELQSIVHSFQAVERQLRENVTALDKRAVQLSTLKELSDLCYVTFDSDDLFAITLERAMKLTQADVGSVLILEGPGRETFVVQGTYGLGNILKKGDRIDFASSIAKFAVINKSPLLIEDIETDNRFGRSNRFQYATKSFLCMPLKGTHDVFGVLTLSRKAEDRPFSLEDADILAPLLSNAAFTYDNLNLIRENKENRRQLASITGICRTLGSSLRNSELLHAVLGQFGEEVAFDAAVIFATAAGGPDRIEVLDILSSLPLPLDRHNGYDVSGSVLEEVLRQGSNRFIADTATLKFPFDRELLVKPGLRTCLLAPLKTGGSITGLLLLGSTHPESFTGIEPRAETIATLLPLAMEKSFLLRLVSQRVREMESIKQIGSILAASTFEREEVLKHTMDMIRTIMNVEAGSLLLLEKEILSFQTAFNIQADIPLEKIQRFQVKLGQGISGYCAARGEPLIVRDIGRSRQFDAEFDRQTGFTTRSVLCVPLISRGAVLGVIEVLNKIQGDFNDDDLQLLQSIATSVSIALENSRLYQETLSLAEHERGIRNMFQKFVPREIVEKIIHSSPSEKPLLEELKILTLLNIDIRGFSSLSRTIGPQRTVAMLNHFFATMGDIVFKHHGIVDKYLGDGFLAIFGAPVSSAADAVNALSAALEMKRALPTVNEQFSGDLVHPLAMGISIHTGEAVVGNIGFEQKMDYTVIGDSVNVVFRLQEFTKSMPNSILISEKTRQAALDSRLDLREVGSYDAGSLLGELKIFELLGRQERTGSGR